MIYANNLTRLALASLLVSSVASAQSGSSLTLDVADIQGQEFDSGRAGEIYAEFEAILYPFVPNPYKGKATIELWNRSGTPRVAYDVTLSIECTDLDYPTQVYSGSLANDGFSRKITIECLAGDIISARAIVKRR